LSLRDIDWYHEEIYTEEINVEEELDIKLSQSSSAFLYKYQVNKNKLFKILDKLLIWNQIRSDHLNLRVFVVMCYVRDGLYYFWEELHQKIKWKDFQFF